MKLNKFVDYELKVLTSHNNYRVLFSTTFLDLHSHLPERVPLFSSQLPRNSRLIAMFRPRPAHALLSALSNKYHLCEKMTQLRDMLARKVVSITRLKLLHLSWLFFAIYVDLINILVSYMYDFNTFFFGKSFVLDIWKVRCWHISRGVIVMYGIYIGTDQIWTWRQ